ncbi:DNA polymerase III subunit delta [Auraticoccus monumenti]|uniref:DNA-directed DNA polymerase n=1 Tax=Auraticoccus monumenti TaxID=675864 RepID=A0A1G7EI74_9ACTN|nr:DNA polymerase III subunit delta [Auraticoccus monumenti]SDE63379.1 DNA polymerase III, delta subunit [Auraticoccus monumenti]
MAVRESVLGRVVLVSGPESLLAERAVNELVNAARGEAPDADLHDVEAPQLNSGQLAEITGGSLFASSSVAVVRDLANLPAELADQVLQLAQAPEPECAVVLVHGGGVKGKGLLDKLKKAGVQVVDCPSLKAWELPQFVTAEVRRARSRIEAPAATLLVEAVGHDLRALAGAVSQLVADADGPEITDALVRRYFGGRAEVTSFAVADAALAGRTDQAMEQLRWALGTGVAHVLVSSALASGLRGLGKLVSLPSTGMRDGDIAREVGVPPWKIKSMRQQLRGWDQPGLARAISIVARADADIKGAANDPDYALESAVLGVTRCRTGR